MSALDAQREDGLPRCTAWHAAHGQCEGIDGIEDHRHYGPRNAGLHEQDAWAGECEHLSWTGVDQTPLDDPAKVWRCDGCGKTATDISQGAIEVPLEVEVVDLVGALRGAVEASRVRRAAEAKRQAALCPRCHGAGEVVHPDDAWRHELDPDRRTVTCPGCGGTGKR